jgi:hypothetical protein
LAGFDFSRIFFVQIAVGHDFRVTEQRVGVKVELRVNGFDAAVAFEDQGVDFDQRRVGVHVNLVQLLQHVHALSHGAGGHADALSEHLGLCVGQAEGWVHKFGDDFFGCGMSHFLDVHATFGGDDERHALGSAVGHGRHVVFFFDVGAVFDQQAADFLAFWASLVGDELHAQNFTGDFADIVNRAGQLNATALATATGVNLRLDNPHGAAQFLSGFHRFLNGKCWDAARHRHTGLAQDFLALVFVNLHEDSLRRGGFLSGH